MILLRLSDSLWNYGVSNKRTVGSKWLGKEDTPCIDITELKQQQAGNSEQTRH